MFKPSIYRKLSINRLVARGRAAIQSRQVRGTHPVVVRNINGNMRSLQ